MRVVFFGTPEFAVPSLRALVDEGAEVVAVVTRPDRPKGRSRSTVVPSAVKQAATRLGLPVLQPERPRGDVFLAGLRRLNPDLGVVVAYGHLLRPEVLAIMPRGMINVHASLLPRHRGAAPVQAALLAGDTITGVTVMQMDEGLDTGPILHQLRTPIAPEETAGELTRRLADLGAQALVEALVLLQRGELRPTPQDDSRATYAPRIEREAARVRWEAGHEAVARQLRAFDPEPGAWSTLDGREVKLFRPVAAEGDAEAGLVVGTEPVLLVGTGTGMVGIAEVQPAGGKRMPSAAWCRGRGARVGQRFA
jgi:methionyl-tRNA formyltransferase